MLIKYIITVNSNISFTSVYRSLTKFKKLQKIIENFNKPPKHTTPYR